MLQKKLKKFFSFLENSRISPLNAIITLGGLVIIRLLIEFLLSPSLASFKFIYLDFFHTLFFFSSTTIFIILLLSRITKEKLNKLASLAIWGNLLILFPPIIDYFLSKGNGYWSFYEFDGIKNLLLGFITFFQQKPEMGITYGSRIVSGFLIIAITLYIYTKTKKIFKTLLGFIALYIFIFIMGSLPSLITIGLLSFSKDLMTINDLNVAKIFLTPLKIFNTDTNDLVNGLNIKMLLVHLQLFLLLLTIFLYKTTKKQLFNLTKNFRQAQILYHGGLIVIGMGLAVIFNDIKINFNFFNSFIFFAIIESVGFAWLASVVANDIFDKEIDKKTNQKRPLIQGIVSTLNYKIIGIIFFLSSLALSSFISIRLTAFLLIYQALAWIYSAHPLRLKKFPIVAPFTSALASVLILSAGYCLAMPNFTLNNLPLPIILLLLITYTLSLPLKDFKDIAGDKAEKIYTLPVIFPYHKAKLIVAISVFISFVLSVVILKLFNLSIIAILFGSLAFYLITNMQNNPKSRINTRNIHWWIFLIVFLYGLFLVREIF